MPSCKVPLFGTDGIRGPFGSFPLDRPTVSALAYRLTSYLRDGGGQPSLVLGGDTRSSTEDICRWISAATTTAGGRVLFTGTVPTPAVAFIARSAGAAAGVAVSASHNLVPDNGIKIIDGLGFKWDREREQVLEDAVLRGQPLELEVSAESPKPDESLRNRYLEHLQGLLQRTSHLSGLRIVVDCANGAGSDFAGPAFGHFGADVVLINHEPTGENINRNCGSTHPEVVASAVRRHQADLGVALDGDADRAVFADHEGQVWDGDAALYLWATTLRRAERLHPPRVVATTMSNLGLERALAREGIEVVRCDVGDREVVETMRQHGVWLGGEQSGHLVHAEASTTGDGLMTALSVAATVADTGRPLAELLQPFQRFPQILRNVKVSRKPPLDSLPAVSRLVADIQGRLGQEGRLVLRYSGTEPLARIMIEGPDQSAIESLAQELAEVLKEELEELHPEEERSTL